MLTMLKIAYLSRGFKEENAERMAKHDWKVCNRYVTLDHYQLEDYVSEVVCAILRGNGKLAEYAILDYRNREGPYTVRLNPQHPRMLNPQRPDREVVLPPFDEVRRNTDIASMDLMTYPEHWRWIKPLWPLVRTPGPYDSRDVAWAKREWNKRWVWLYLGTVDRAAFLAVWAYYLQSEEMSLRDAAELIGVDRKTIKRNVAKVTESFRQNFVFRSGALIPKPLQILAF